MAEKKFKTGDDVVLKSGGPRMTINKYVSNDSVKCDWYNGTDFTSRTFLQDQLKLYESPTNHGIIISGSTRNYHY